MTERKILKGVEMRKREYIYQIIDEEKYKKNKMIPLIEMENSVRLGNVLKNNDFDLIDDILGISERDILRLKNCHMVTKKELNLMLSEDYGVASVASKMPEKKLNQCLNCGLPTKIKYCSRYCYFKNKKKIFFSERDLTIQKLRQGGNPMVEIGKIYGLSRQRIYQIIANLKSKGIENGIK